MIETVPMTVNDIDDVLKVEENCFAIAWTREDFMREMEKALGFLGKFERLVSLNERVQFLCDEIDHVNKGAVTSLEIDRGIHEISALLKEYTETF